MPGFMTIVDIIEIYWQSILHHIAYFDLINIKNINQNLFPRSDCQTAYCRLSLCVYDTAIWCWSSIGVVNKSQAY